MSQRILELADELEEAGVDVSHLRPLQEELDLVERPGVVRRLSAKALEVARRQWTHAMGELRESREMVALVTRRARTREKWTPEEADVVRTQLADLLKLVPATVIAATNQVLPLPGTSLFTPMLLRKMGLLPSRWREAHVLHELHAEADRLHAAGRHRLAERVEALQHELEDEADARVQCALEAELLTHWDLDGNGVLDVEERAALQRECQRVRELVRDHGHRRRWYLATEGSVVGPLRLSTQLPEGMGSVMVCFDGRTGWVPLRDVLPV